MKYIPAMTAAFLLLLVATPPAFAQAADNEQQTHSDEATEPGHTDENDDAVVAARKALEETERSVGPDHPEVATSLVSLGSLYDTQGKYELAEPLYKRALAIREKALGPDHPEVATDLNYLGMLYYNQGKYALAEPLHKRALAIDEKALGLDHPDLAIDLNNLGLLYDTQGKYELAEPLYKRALAIREKALGPDHAEVATDLSNLGFFYYNQGKYALAEPLYTRALAIREEALGPDHPQVIQILKKLAMLYSKQGKHAPAETLYARIASVFSPPDAQQRRDAVGSVEGLSETMRRALETADHFQPIPKPDHHKGDWLVMHDEPGQTFGQFVDSNPNKPTGERRKIYLQPLGDFAETTGPSLELLREFTSAFFAMTVEVSEPIDLEGAQITTRINPYTQKTQFLTVDLLKLLKQRLPEDAFCVVGVTMTDLYPAPSWNFVFGQASFRERVGVYSFARYDPRFHGEKATDDVEAVMLRRSCKILAHETGHMFGIEHCIFFSCQMNGSNHMAESDQSPAHFCPVDLRKLQHSIGFDVVDRYRKLRTFWHEAGWADETKWLTDRLRHIDPDFAEPAVVPE